MPFRTDHALHVTHSAWVTHVAPRLSRTRAQLHQRFTEHPRATDETYLQHLAFTLGMAAKLVGTGVVVFIHGLFPFLFTRTASQQMAHIWRIMSHRGMKPPADDIGSHI